MSHKIFQNWAQDAKLAAFGLGLMLFFRTALLVAFHNHLGEPTLGDFGLMYARAALFDVRVVLVVALPTIILSLVTPFWDISNVLNTIRLWIGSFFAILTTILGVSTIGYFYEYGDQFNYRLYGLFYDDFTAIIESIWKAYPVIWVGLIIVALSFAVNRLLKRILNTNIKIPFPRNVVMSSVLGLVLIALLAIGLRGSIESRPLQRDDIAVTTDDFLNKLVPNPYFALYYTRSDHKHLNKAFALKQFIPDGDIEAALGRFFPNEQVSSRNIDDWMIRTVKDPKTNKPSHIFLIVLESQDAWPLLDEFSHLNLTPNLKRYSDSGITVPAFVSAGTSTRTSLNAIISGLPDASVYTNFQPRSQTPYPTAIALAMKDLGYTTNLFYGGRLSWQRLGEFAKNQGFDNTYGREHMPLNTPGDSWGVFDDKLFEYILSTVDSDKPSFNLIMTTSNHSPYPVDLEVFGCPIRSEPTEALKQSASSLDILGHVWYNDHCTGEFVESAKNQFSKPLFIITGDHTSRRYYSKKPTLYESKCVPCIFYGPKVVEEAKVLPGAGSHLDIVSTLIPMIAPQGYEYHALGNDLLEGNATSGLGADVAITAEQIQYVWCGTTCQSMPWDISERVLDPILSTRYNDLHAIGWWRIIRGAEY